MYESTDPNLRFAVLGPLTATLGKTRLDLGSVPQQVLLAVLLLHAGTPVERSRLMDDIWGADAPAYAVNLLQKRISALRRVLEPARGRRAPSHLITWSEAGYRLEVPGDRLDLQDFEDALARGRAAAAEGDHAAAARELQAALTLWRGPAFEGLHSPLLDAERDRLEERRVGVVEDRIEADLAAGNQADIIAELRTMVAGNPLRERLHRLLMLALYRAGRQADALTTFRDARRQLHDQLGIEPGQDLALMHQRILAADPALDRAPAEEIRLAGPSPADPAPPRPAQLPHAPADFVGRADAVRHLDSLLEEEGASGGTVVISAIAGTAGVGKTTLALHWAHRIRHRFPDGQLHVNLRGFHPAGSPLEPTEVLKGFIEALGVSSQRIPASVESQIGLYRSLLADRRVLILLDNALDSDQVRPLLPGTAGCLVIVTSRHDLTGLVAVEDARPIALDLLSPAEARVLLRRRIGAARLDAEPAAVDQIIAACARLPLALTVAAARAATRPGYPLRVLADELHQARRRLDAFDDGDRATDVRAVFSWSYQSLSPAAARLFRLMALHLGQDAAAPAVASLAGVPVADLRAPMSELIRAHLVTEHVFGRFGFHDLLRAYAAELTQTVDTAADRDAAIRRLLDHYIHTANRAQRLLGPPEPLAPPHAVTIEVPAMLDGVAVAEITGHDEAMSWFDTELSDLLAALVQAFDAGFAEQAWLLTIALTPFLESQGVWYDEWSGELASRPDELHQRALVQRLLGRACARLGRHDQAQDHLREALGHYRCAGDVVGQAMVHRDLCWDLGQEARHQD
ncbi:BTAD domain-containing putative transcriptional regulator, partial [Actinoplanes sp. NPDC051633]|uniref:AfsR/SARP family transcriptional regulator n=1 Tax=Actinoplanes sp. NPDC051633 TaxID=3155670 RepID=UPI00343929DD